ncbi:hypothetical protein THTE_0984 [Thermogutta terrifontis]|uniref:Uncharacterized protein n=1 Tax=Thermogutta terrifontis TaxID=1331910 RepID=A0A286RCA0_9BACT|nr:hypothetical protein THTE_0984 [Thermogutta terrifontis]
MQIDTESALFVAKDYLLDALIPLNSVTFDESQAHCEILLLLPDKSMSRYKRILPFVYWRTVPFRRWKLVFREVTSVEYKYDAGAMRTGYFSVGDISFSAASGVSIVTHEGLTIHVAMARLVGQLIRTTEVENSHTLQTIVLRLCRPRGQAASSCCSWASNGCLLAGATRTPPMTATLISTSGQRLGRARGMAPWQVRPPTTSPAWKTALLPAGRSGLSLGASAQGAVAARVPAPGAAVAVVPEVVPAAAAVLRPVPVGAQVGTTPMTRRSRIPAFMSIAITARTTVAPAKRTISPTWATLSTIIPAPTPASSRLRIATKKSCLVRGKVALSKRQGQRGPQSLVNFFLPS